MKKKRKTKRGRKAKRKKTIPILILPKSKVDKMHKNVNNNKAKDIETEPFLAFSYNINT